MLTPEQILQINELKCLKLPKVWLEIAELVGPEIFIKIWKIASTPENQDRNALYVPAFNKYLEFQKTQLIKQFLAFGMNNQEISKQLNTYGMKTSNDSIRRICQKFNLNSGCS